MRSDGAEGNFAGKTHWHRRYPWREIEVKCVTVQHAPQRLAYVRAEFVLTLAADTFGDYSLRLGGLAIISQPSDDQAKRNAQKRGGE